MTQVRFSKDCQGEPAYRTGRHVEPGIIEKTRLRQAQPDTLYK